MKSSYSVFMQSRFFDPMFNSAVFDGPFRIYFNQMHESLALKIYFMLNQKLEDLSPELRDFTRKTDRHVFVLLYPNSAQYQHVFSKLNLNTANISEVISSEHWEEDLVFGLARPLEDSELIGFIDNIKVEVKHWLDQGSQIDSMDPIGMEYSEEVVL